MHRVRAKPMSAHSMLHSPACSHNLRGSAHAHSHPSLLTCYSLIEIHLLVRQHILKYHLLHYELRFREFCDFTDWKAARSRNDELLEHLNAVPSRNSAECDLQKVAVGLALKLEADFTLLDICVKHACPSNAGMLSEAMLRLAASRKWGYFNDAKGVEVNAIRVNFSTYSRPFCRQTASSSDLKITCSSSMGQLISWCPSQHIKMKIVGVVFRTSFRM